CIGWRLIWRSRKETSYSGLGWLLVIGSFGTSAKPRPGWLFALHPLFMGLVWMALIVPRSPGFVKCRCLGIRSGGQQGIRHGNNRRTRPGVYCKAGYVTGN